jgi:prolyl-tRNA synthetase
MVNCERCSHCGGGLTYVSAVEVGNIFQLGTHYAESLGAYAVAANGRRQPVVMGSYGIGVSRVLATLIERYHDGMGIALPAAVAAFDVHVIAIGGDAGQDAQGLHDALCNARLDVLLEDRAVRSGEAFAEADLMGATLRIVLGGRSALAGRAEIRERRSGAIYDVAKAEIVEASVRLLEQIRSRERAHH